jgi:hypothetical protein
MHEHEPQRGLAISSDLGTSNKQQLFTNGEHIDRAFMREKVLSFDVGFILVYDFCILRVLHSFSCLFISFQHFVSDLAIVAASATFFLLYTYWNHPNRPASPKYFPGNINHALNSFLTHVSLSITESPLEEALIVMLACKSPRPAASPNQTRREPASRSHRERAQRVPSVISLSGLGSDSGDHHLGHPKLWIKTI